MSEPELKRSRPWWRKIRTSLSLRMLMVLVLVMGGGLGWLVRRATVQRRAVEVITKAGGQVMYDYQYNGKPPAPGASSPWPKWLVEAVGMDYFHNVVGVWFHPNGKRDADALSTDALMAYIAQLDKLVFLDLDRAQGEPLTDAGFAHVVGLDRLENLHIRSPGLTDAGLAPLAKLTQPRLLHLKGTSMTDAGLAHLRGLTRLNWLDLSGNSGIHGSGLVNLAGMPKLVDLNLDQTPIDEAGLSNLSGPAGRHMLRTLVLSGPGITDEGLAKLARLGDLSDLTICDAPVTSAGLAHLKRLTSLTYLTLQAVQVDDLGPLAPLTQFRELTVVDAPINDAGLAALASMPNLKKLTLDSTKITDAGLAQVVPLKGLELLSLRKTKVTDAGLDGLANLSNCKRLTLFGTTVTPAAIARLHGRFPAMWIEGKALPGSSPGPEAPAN
jgi:internalin A